MCCIVPQFMVHFYCELIGTLKDGVIMKEQTIYLVVNVPSGFVLGVYDDCLAAAERCDDFNTYFEDAKFKVVRLYEEDIIKVGELNAN